MRLWSLHPQHLDAKGLVALWREGLLAQKVLQGNTRGYRNHPQLHRFKQQPDPVASVAAYLQVVQQEAARRGYRFDASKLALRGAVPPMPVTEGQIAYERMHLEAKLMARDPAAYARLMGQAQVAVHPAFAVVPGGIEPWEVVTQD